MSAPASDLPSALAALDAILARLRGRQTALFLDYDGTLTPIVERPEDALLSEGVRTLLGRLARRWRVAIVSGRDRQVVERLVGLAGLAYVGSHGLDIAGPAGSGIHHQVAQDFLPTLDAAERALRARLTGVEGALVERKRFTVAAHYRRVAEHQRRAVAAAVDEVRGAHPRLRKESGKAVFELRPDIDWDKGKAVLWLLDALAPAQAVPVYVGDDLTDETAFTALAGSGIGVVVGAGSRPTAATFALGDPAEVLQFLGRLATALEA